MRCKNDLENFCFIFLNNVIGIQEMKEKMFFTEKTPYYLLYVSGKNYLNIDYKMMNG